MPTLTLSAFSPYVFLSSGVLGLPTIVYPLTITQQLHTCSVFVNFCQYVMYEKQKT